jgi:hypothetical protein
LPKVGRRKKLCKVADRILKSFTAAPVHGLSYHVEVPGAGLVAVHSVSFLRHFYYYCDTCDSCDSCDSYDSCDSCDYLVTRVTRVTSGDSCYSCDSCDFLENGQFSGKLHTVPSCGGEATPNNKRLENFS